MQASEHSVHRGKAALAAAVAAAAAHLRGGGVVVAPTETFYGLVVRADDARAVAQVLALKGRAPSKPLPLVAADAAACNAACWVSPAMERLMRAFWPGPLSLVLPARHPLWPQACRSQAPAALGQDVSPGYLAVRVSGHPFVRALAAELGCLLTATSANVAGAAPACTVAQVVLGSGTGADTLVIDGGRTPGGLPSTLVAEERGEPLFLRLGAICAEDVRCVWAARGSPSGLT